MKNYRLNGVSFIPSGALPIMLACTKEKADGLVVREAKGTNLEATKRLRFVRVVDSNALRMFVSDGNEFQREYGEVPVKERSRLLGLQQLVEALKTGDRTAWSWAVKHLASSAGPTSEEYERLALQRQPAVELVKKLAEGLKEVQLVMWWKEEGEGQVIELGLRCPDACTALYTLAVMSIVGGGEGIGACLECGKPFVRRRKTKRFCSSGCRYNMHLKKVAATRRKSARRRQRR